MTEGLVVVALVLTPREGDLGVQTLYSYARRP